VQTRDRFEAAMKDARPADLREACIEEAFRIVEEDGVESLSLREVARRLGVSHQAPYRHFPSRDHMLAEIIARSFREFADFLRQRPACDDPAADLEAMGLRYLDYALRRPLSYQLMFNTPKPDPEQHPQMMREARYAFDQLRERLDAMTLRPAGPNEPPSPSLDALFIWSTLHGLASILKSEALGSLGLTEAEIRASVRRCLARIGLAIEDSPVCGSPA